MSLGTIPNQGSKASFPCNLKLKYHKKYFIVQAEKLENMNTYAMFV